MFETEGDEERSLSESILQFSSNGLIRGDSRTITLVLPVPGGPWMREKGGVTC